SITGVAKLAPLGTRSSGLKVGAGPEVTVTLGFTWTRTSSYQETFPHGSSHHTRLKPARNGFGGLSHSQSPSQTEKFHSPTSPLGSAAFAPTRARSMRSSVV